MSKMGKPWSGIHHALLEGGERAVGDRHGDRICAEAASDLPGGPPARKRQQQQHKGKIPRSSCGQPSVERGLRKVVEGVQAQWCHRACCPHRCRLILRSLSSSYGTRRATSLRRMAPFRVPPLSEGPSDRYISASSSTRAASASAAKVSRCALL